jgi:3-hydroxybutyryl-CoA dehydrogenase
VTAVQAVERVGIVGLGTMGAGIAEVCSKAGVTTVGWEPTDDLASRGRAVVERQLARQVGRGKLTQTEANDVAARFETSSDFGRLSDCDLVIEAVVEDLAVKRDVFSRLEQVVGGDAVLATNTSALSVTQIAAALERPERVVGMHFFNPVPVLPLVEVVRARLSSETAVATAQTFVERIGKQPIVCRDSPGFVVNRMLIPVLNEAVRALEQDVASAEEIDVAMRSGASWPIGPLALIDLIGVDTYVLVCDALWNAFHENQFTAAPSLRRMVEAGLLGRKSGRGFFEYSGS